MSLIEKEVVLPSINAKLPYLRLVLPILVMVLVACDARIIAYKGTCAEQTQQFMDYIHALVVDEFTPVIEDGLESGPTVDLMKRIDGFNTQIGEINIPECNPGAEVVKDALLQYMLETRNYFMVVANRSLYGEGSVQGQWAKMYEAGFAFENVFADLRK